MEDLRKGIDSVVVGLRVQTVIDLERYLENHLEKEVYVTLKELLNQYLDIIKSGRTGSDKKKVLSPYNLFIRDAIHRIKSNHPDMKGQDLMRKATEAWLAHKASSKIS